jgi:glycosyltransferase involved in cell wall biosynthesis
VRPSVDVVVPFAGSEEGLRQLVARLRVLTLADRDTLTIADNRPAGVAPDGVLAVRERQSSYFARNAAAAVGSGQWLLFVDADVEPPPDLIDRYFAEPPGDAVGLLAGGIDDEPPGAGGTPVARYLYMRASMDDGNTLRGDWAYAQTANCAVRRSAFEQIGGFRDDIRSGGDADLSFRLRRAGWELAGRPGARVRHDTRATLKALVRQRARHGSGCAWLDAEYPGAFPPSPLPGLTAWTLRRLAHSAGALARGNREDAAQAAIDPVSSWAFRLGRRLSNGVR